MITYVKGDLFQATKGKSGTPLLLAHACNCLGIWGGGIANVFRAKFHSSYELYNDYCTSQSSPSDLLGTSLLLPVSSKDAGYVNGLTKRAIIVCLFTSVMGQESEHEIAKFTAEAMQDLKLQLENPERIENRTVRNIVTSYNNQTSQNNTLVDVSNYTVNMPKINSGIFGVPWELTEKALIESGMDCQVFEL